MKITGIAVKLGNHINTDLIISGKHKYRTQVISELTKYVFEDLDPKLKDKLAIGSVIVAGKNFGCGSSREQAPRVLKAAGVRAIVAESFARIFFRNSVNVGLPTIVVNLEYIRKIKDGDSLTIDLIEGRVFDNELGIDTKVSPYPKFILDIINDGGIAEYYKRFNAFPWDGKLL
ncbi:MAG: 3-isopropylmalate dehydratase [Nitrososphaeria archaeon]